MLCVNPITQLVTENVVPFIKRHWNSRKRVGVTGVEWYEEEFSKVSTIPGWLCSPF